jgi:protein-S-isoprenylcysteine O-methyltransferase Ste14
MWLTIKIAIFILVSIFFVWLSWSSLKSLRFHGFYRFFAFESILILVLLNVNYWFVKPFGLYQIISWILLTICTFMAAYGFITLQKLGKPDKKRDDPSIKGVERTTALVTTGAYNYIRHPLYSSLIYGAWGVFFKQMSALTFALAVIIVVFTTLTAKIEESENISFFGEAYRDYMKRTKMFIPFIF